MLQLEEFIKNTIFKARNNSNRKTTMKQTFLSLLLFFTLSSSSHLFAQSSFKFYDDISLPQTDAWNFVRQGEVSPSLYTGTINLSVPIYEYKDKDFTIPIVATYSSNGNQPNQIVGILGPGWNLDLGGCITIETNGIPDYGENVKHVQGFYTVHKNNPFTSHQPSQWWRFMFNLLDNGSGTGAPQIVWVPGTAPSNNHEGEVDAQPDIFHFSVPGHSGKFHLGFHGDVIFYDTPLNPNGYRLQIDTVPISNLPYQFSKFYKLTIITPDGYRYIFSGDPQLPSVDLAKSGERVIFDIITAWHLTRIEAPSGRWASFQYYSERLDRTTFSPATAVYSGGLTDNQYYFEDPIVPSCSSPDGTLLDGLIYRRETKTARLNHIVFSDGSMITLTYDVLDSSSGDQYKETPSSAQVKGYANTVRLSDIYVSRAGNSNPVAHASFSHARNTNGGQTNYLQSITVEGIGTYSFQYNGWNDASKPYPLQNTFSVDHWGYFNGKDNTAYFPPTSAGQTTEVETISGSSRNPDSNYARLGMINKITYPTGGYTTFEYEPHDYSVAVVRNYDTLSSRNYAPRLVQAFGVAGGLRIKKISSFLANGTPGQEKTYDYSDANGNSSGILIWTPRYSVSFKCQATFRLQENASYKSSSFQDYGFTGIEYRNVTERMKDSTRTLNVFTSCADGRGFMDRFGAYMSGSVMERARLSNGTTAAWEMFPLLTSTPHSVHYVVSPLTSFQSQRGMLKEKKVFKNDTTLSASLKETTSFLLDTTSFTDLPCYLVRRFGTYSIFTGKHLPKETVSVVRQDDMTQEKVSKTLMEYNFYWEATKTKTIRPDGDTLITEFTHLRDLEDNVINSSTVYSAMKRRNILTLPIEEKAFRKKAGGNSELIAGKRFTYALFPNGADTLILPVLVESYDLTSQTWKKEAKILSYDNFGNITQLEDAAGNNVSYLWSADGRYLILQAKGLSLSQVQQVVTSTNISASTGIPDSQDRNLRSAFPNAEITTLRYLCGVGPNWMKDASGTITEYTYTPWGKLNETKRYSSASSSPKATKTTYSNDN